MNTLTIIYLFGSVIGGAIIVAKIIVGIFIHISTTILFESSDGH
tara:strand:+ start:20963 stop:21094 length:132 start_codon:yes stop_codon:yes gene_type:complete